MTPLSALIVRAEEGTGPDRELDACVAFAAGAFDWKLSYGLEHCRIERGEKRDDEWVSVIVKSEKGGGLHYTEPYARYTTSLDAVLSLIEQKLPGWGHCYATGWDAEGNCGGFVSPERTVDLTKAIMGQSKTPARALLAATLKALSALEDSKADLADATNGDRT